MNEEEPTQWTIERHLQAKPAEVVELYHRFIELAEECGPFTYAVAKTSITLKGTRRGFAGATPKAHALVGYLDLTAHRRRPKDHQRVALHQAPLRPPLQDHRSRSA